jgi:hypothetical protein
MYLVLIVKICGAVLPLPIYPHGVTHLSRESLYSQEPFSDPNPEPKESSSYPDIPFL